jgi:hypothetical protein
MSEALQEHYANEAKRLVADDTFAEALTRVRMQALNDLATANADDKTAILRLQAKVAVTIEILDELSGMILAMGASDGGFDPNKQPG